MIQGVYVSRLSRLPNHTGDLNVSLCRLLVQFLLHPLTECGGDNFLGNTYSMQVKILTHRHFFIINGECVDSWRFFLPARSRAPELKVQFP